MPKRRLIAIFIAFILTIAVTAMWSATTDERDGNTDANLISDSGSLAGEVSEVGEGSESSDTVEKKKGGNKVARIFKAPFKAFGKLFGRKNNDGKFQRMTEKDAEKFESVAVTRVEDSRNPDSAEVSTSASASEHLETGRTHLIEGQLNSAIAELSTATSIDPKLGEAHNLLGVAFSQKGMPDRAKESYERAVKIEPHDAQTLNNLGFSLYQNGNYRAAVDRLKRAIKIAPHDERISNNLGLALARLGKFEDAHKNFVRANGEMNGSINMARMMERFGREEDAIKYYESARRVDPKNSFALRRLANLYKRNNKTQEAQTALNALATVSAEVSVSLGGK